MKPWQKYLLIAMVALLLLYLIGQAVRPRAYGIPITNVVYRLKRHWWKAYDTRELSQIDSVVIHHSLTKSGNAEAYARYHVEENGWAGIGYHYVIGKEGSIEQTQLLKTASNHTSGQNTRSVGICLTGNYDIQQPPPVQVEAAVKLIRYLQDRLGRQLRITGHNEHSSKSCPGSNLNVDEIENSVRNTAA
jgi:N-acetyl-anhydromuramyl-L-alanine amidase AmpD